QTHPPLAIAPPRAGHPELQQPPRSEAALLPAPHSASHRALCPDPAVSCPRETDKSPDRGLLGCWHSSRRKPSPPPLVDPPAFCHVKSHWPPPFQGWRAKP